MYRVPSPAPTQRLSLRFDGGRLLLSLPPGEALPPEFESHFVPDHRLPGCWSTEAFQYRTVREQLGEALLDDAAPLEIAPFSVDLSVLLPTGATLHAYQERAIDAWWQMGGCGLVVAPTAAGKTAILAAAIDKCQQQTLVIAPTIPLAQQLYSQLRQAADVPVGLFLTHTKDIQPITVTTYHSAPFLHREQGRRWGLIVFDEVHHLPGPSFQLGARMAVAPYRLGVTATPERDPERAAILRECVGPVAYSVTLAELQEVEAIAPYLVSQIEVDLTPDERQTYDQSQQQVNRFIEHHNISPDRSLGYFEPLRRLSWKSQEGKGAFRAYQEMRRVAERCEQKWEVLRQLLLKHADEKVIIFCPGKAEAYRLSQEYLIPAITSDFATPAKREELLDLFRYGEVKALAAVETLDEGVSIPQASVAIYLAGSGQNRQMVQRLGRVLRKAEGKEMAMFYEIIAADTVEVKKSARRRQGLGEDQPFQPNLF
ncbi:DEAD/DEAH box helicase [Leptolyngbya sp. FACHB-261]|uniref:DEAD/DEAH box helicase n=1 Tax=Leptolyngbya sp. FACHB-261 TaxID=2692806 RepID=UPI0016867754|nr:DEAD/DEAH box helicase [Leptolyngbya sp. FACHB-261]MBD2102063.1 DEAD/DEAH box helicase [Leptolyngbya sp. FACHB-261]